MMQSVTIGFTEKLVAFPVDYIAADVNSSSLELLKKSCEDVSNQKCERVLVLGEDGRWETITENNLGLVKNKAKLAVLVSDNRSTDYFKETLEEIRHNTAITRRTVSHFMIQRVQDYMDPGSTNSSNPNEESFRKEVTQHYGYKNARNVPELCMLTGREHDWHDLAAGHIVPRARAAQARVDVNIWEINNARNGIYWSRAVEGAWSAGIFCFASPAPDVFKFTLLDKSYSDQRVQDWPLGRNPLRTSTKNNLGDMTWGHLHATGQLQFLPGNAGRPYRRALCFMAHMALLSSSQRSLVRPDDVDSQADEFDYMSEDGKIEETVAWINHMKIDHKAEGGSEESEEQEVEEL